MSYAYCDSCKNRLPDQFIEDEPSSCCNAVVRVGVPLRMKTTPRCPEGHEVEEKTGFCSTCKHNVIMKEVQLKQVTPPLYSCSKCGFVTGISQIGSCRCGRPFAKIHDPRNHLATQYAAFT